MGEKKIKKIGLFMIHGFSGSNEEFKDLDDFFTNKGITVRVPMLLGHGTAPEDMLRVSSADWEKQVNQELDNLAKEVDVIFLGGISFGGNLAIHIAKDNPNVKGLFLLGTVIWFYGHWLVKISLPIINIFKTYYKKKINPKHFFGTDAMKRRKAYPVAPIKNLIEMIRYIDERTKKELAEIRIPTMILHSAHDAAVNPKSASYIFNRIGSNKKELHWVKYSHHNLVIDEPRIKVFQEMYDFMIKNLNHYEIN